MITSTQWQFGVYSKGSSLTDRSEELLPATPLSRGRSLLCTSVSWWKAMALKLPSQTQNRSPVRLVTLLPSCILSVYSYHKESSLSGSVLLQYIRQISYACYTGRVFFNFCFISCDLKRAVSVQLLLPLNINALESHIALPHPNLLT